MLEAKITSKKNISNRMLYGKFNYKPKDYYKNESLAIISLFFSKSYSPR